MGCKICLSKTSLFASAKALNRYRINYYLCGHCGFIQTEEPYWLHEAYGEAINSTDVGLVGRNVTIAKRAKALISLFFNSDGKFLDYGGGYGLFVRLMRDSGFNFYWYDKFSPNLFARGFEAPLVNPEQYELVTAFEVFEHLANPMDEIERMLEFSTHILFSTELVPPDRPKPGQWWYYAPEHGQHISFYTLQSLPILAKKFHLNIYSNGRSFHLLTKKKISSFVFRFVSFNKLAQIFDFIWKRKSLLENDYQEAIKTFTLDRRR
ncbi:MAG: class I SAM-dependent methyltransferase [Deltaproteobacteria bacterium]|nr:class I SAM-dependent methyltransferase [Deltaproteobacteria bacterium]